MTDLVVLLNAERIGCQQTGILENESLLVTVCYHFKMLILFFSDVVVQVVVEGVNVMLATQEMELTAQVSFTVDTLLTNCQS